MMKKLMSVAIAVLLCMALMMPGIAEIFRIGDSDEMIAQLQSRLVELGYTETETDGTFGEGTRAAITRFQQLNDLLVTGMADEVTQRVLMSEGAAAYYEEEDLWVEDVEYGVFEMSDMMAAVPMFNSKSMNASMAYEAEWNTREYTTFGENGFLSAATSPLSTFAADVDTASWTQLRQMILRGESIPKDSVRIEEMLNYFNYDYKEPTGDEPFGVTMEMGECPWRPENKLLLIGLQAKKVETESVPMNMVFLIDVSGSMDEPDKLPLAKRAFLLMLDVLRPEDTISIVTYASGTSIVLDGVPAANKTQIMDAINDLEAGGSTNGAEGICTAYDLAEKHFVKDGVNRILLATDGDLNVGLTDEGSLARLVTEKKENGVSLTVLGFGGYNYKDNRMEALADYGNGNYRYIDTIHEARRALVTEAGGTFNTVAKDVKLQLDFNPAMVKGYRLIGYEDRLMDAEDFADDAVDGGEVGSGHRVTALYEIVPVDSDFDFGAVESRYAVQSADESGEWLTLSIRAKEPDGDRSELYTYPLKDEESFPAGENLRFAAGVAELGMLLRGSEWIGDATAESALELLRECESVTGDVYKEELIYLAGLVLRDR